MAGRGRARGRSRGLVDQEITSPGGLASRHSDGDAEEVPNGQFHSEPLDVKNSTPDQPTLSLNDMKSILEDSRTYSDQNDVKRVLLCAKNFVRTEEDVRLLALIIYNKCLEDCSLAKRGSEMCDIMSCIEVGNIKFRNCLLNLVQADYKARKEIAVQNPQRFTCFLAFLCNIFGIMRTATDEVFKPLVNPIFDCFNLILNPNYVREDEESVEPRVADMENVNEDACEVFSQELQPIGKLLEENGEEQMQQLIDNIRTCIINSKSLPRVRCSLLEVIEAYARGWEPANNETTRFYCDMSVGLISGLVL
ncbi:CBP80/20-dependent translation initiation factor [Biomphalaria glabrata]|uniref:Uncharacterized protein n=1 Tax=Biomphalaria glabrata TaxID=6526 RepID=A0A2C9LWE2_BIOGL|nr:CBP80/20-dependent translation initiation factor [Biomphalaria glabrata]